MPTNEGQDSRAVLAASLREIRRLRAELRQREPRTHEPVAIVGMGCRMPGGAGSPESFWNFLRDGGDGITEVPASRWNNDLYHDPRPDAAGKITSRRGGFLTDIDRFDAPFFGVSPREAMLLDPQTRLLLEVSWEALEHAGLSPDGLSGTSAGVFFGLTNHDYAEQQLRQIAPADLETYSISGKGAAFAAGRLSYWLGLRGPSLSVDTACSSALVAVHLACQSLRTGESTVALAGGCNVILEPEWSIVLSRGRALSPDGQCRAFDAAANGYVRSEGCGVVVLKLLRDAQRDSDPVLAVIHGSAVNNDGRSSGVTVPNAEAQREAIRTALRSAGVKAEDVSYVEAHGTGTALGDPIEIRALHDVMGGPDRTGPLYVGSVKTNVGHLEAAAGVTGLIKTVLSLTHEEIPPHLHLNEVNPEIDIDSTGIRIPTSITPWPRSGGPRFAGVSSFGASGTNVHMVLGEAPVRAVAADPHPTWQGPHLLVLSAKNRTALTELAGRYRDRIGQEDDHEKLADVCYSAATGRATFSHRLAVTATSAGEMRELLASVAAGQEHPSAAWGRVPPGTQPKTVFLFTGQSSQRPGMGMSLYATEPVFRRTIDECDEILRPLLGRSLLTLLDPAPEDEDLIHETRYTQPVLLAFEYALARLWRSWGIVPSAVLGHSVGELTAACVAGALGLRDALSLAELRGRMMQDLDEGVMASVFAPLSEVTAILPPERGGVCVAAVNGPESVVVAGAGDEVETLLHELAERGITSVRLSSTRAFHSPLVDPMLDAFERQAAQFGFTDPRIPLVSNVTGDFLEPGAFTARYLREHARRPVQFLRGMETLYDQGYGIFLEVGPSPTLLSMASRFAPEPTEKQPMVFLPSMRPEHDEARVLYDSLGTLHTRGAAVKWTDFYGSRNRRKVPAPTYPFQRERHWFQPSESQPTTLTSAPEAPAHPFLGRRASVPPSGVHFSASLDPQVHPCLGDCVIDGIPVGNIGVYLEAALAAATHLHGEQTVTIGDCRVPRSLVVDPIKPVNVRLELERVDDSRYAFRYLAEHHGEDTPTQWALHAQGKMAVGASSAASPSPPTFPDLDTLRGGLSVEISSDTFYRQLWQRKVYLGPAARWVEKLQVGQAEVLAHLRAPRPEEEGRYRLHPGITDSMFQTLFACLPPDSPPDAVYMLVGIDRFVVRAGAVPASLWCHARLLPSANSTSMRVAEVRLLDDTGDVVAHAEGVYLSPASREKVTHAQREPGRRARTERPALAALAPTGHTSPVVTRTPDAVKAGLTEALARVLATTPEAVDLSEPPQNLGLDSLMALQLKDMLADEYGISLPIVALIEGRSLADLADEITGETADDEQAAPMDVPANVSPVSATLEDAPTPVPAVRDDPPLEGDPSPDEVGDRYEPFPLTDLQLAYQIGRTDAFELGNVSTYLFVEVDVTDLDLHRLGVALRRLIGRHDMLRAVTLPDGRQRVLPEVPDYDIRLTDLRHLTDAERDHRLDRAHEELRDQVLDAGTWPLFDIRATLIDERRTRLHLGFDGLIVDARSVALLFRDWVTLYHDSDKELPALSFTFRDHVTALNAESRQYRADEAYWEDRIASLPAAPELPLTRSPRSVRRPVFVHRSAQLSGAEWAMFKKHAAASGVTPSTALCTAYGQVLAEWSSSSRFTLTLLFFNRPPVHPQINDVVGNFSATTLLEMDNAPTDNFTVRAQRIQRQLWTDLEHRQLSGVEVLRRYNRRHGTSGGATMPFVFASAITNSTQAAEDDMFGHTQQIARLARGGEHVHASIRTPQVIIDHQVVEQPDGLLINWDVVEELFPAGMVSAMFGAYLEILRELCRDAAAWRRPARVGVPAADLDMRRAVNATDGPSGTGLLHDPFVARAAEHPERVAMIAADRMLTYGELDRKSDAVARWLAHRTAGPGTLVGIHLEKGWEQVVAVLGTLKSGAAYVPLDTTAPQARLEAVLRQAGISFLITESQPPQWLRELTEVTCLTIDDAMTAGNAGPLEAARRAAPDDLAYVIFTSGSTGTPKGVMIEHRSALNTVLDVNERFKVTEDDRVLALSALHFDLSVYDIFGMLAAGGTIVIPEPETLHEPARWAELSRRHRVTVWNSVPALMDLFTDQLHREHAQRPPDVRLVMLSGDWIPLSLPDRIRSVLPDAEQWSLGGATEAAIWSILHKIDDVDPDWPSIPYGTPMRNQRVHILDEALRPRPTWVPGMIYIAGAGLARGYLGNEEQSRTAFIRHPVTGEILYRTGDLGRYRPDGTVEILGREDFQVKVQGHRIELGDIESALGRCASVRACVASVVTGPDDTKQLIAHVVLDEQDPEHTPVTPHALRRQLGSLLPPYMVPQRLLITDVLPLGPNGKVDRAALASSTSDDESSAPVVPGRTPTERQLVDVWSEFFGSSKIGVTANYFDLGGNSVQAIRLMARIRERTGISLPVSTLFTRPTIADFAEALDEAATSPGAPTSSTGPEAAVPSATGSRPSG